MKNLKCIEKRNHPSPNTVHVALVLQGSKLSLLIFIRNISKYLTFFVKHAKYIHCLKYLFVSVDSLSKYLRFQPLKKKSCYIDSTRLQKNGQTKTTWFDDGTEFHGAFKSLGTCRKRSALIESYLFEKLEGKKN